jgi:Tol biopolymer transport system component
VISGKEQLFTMNVDGSNVAQLTRDDADHEDPAWSPVLWLVFLSLG